MTCLALLRHGHTEWNRAGRIQGRTDIPIDAEARAQLSALRLPADWQDAQIVSSPLSRARQTAELVSGRCPRVETALMEMNWGDWEGAKGAVLHSDPDSGFRDIEDWGWDFCPPGGERPRDLRARLVPWAESLTGATLAVTHIGVMRVLLAHATGWGFDGPAPFAIKRNRLYVIDIGTRGWHLRPSPVRLEPVSQ